MNATGDVRDLAAVVDGLLTVGFASIAAEAELQGASGAALAAGQRILSRRECKEQLGAWSGRGMWSGYQPLPDGDPREVDVVERFELPAAAIAEGPDPATPRGELHAALRAAHDRSIGLIAGLIVVAAAARGHTEHETRSLWLDGHESTTVVNHYPPVLLDPVAMKAHRDFGGLSLLFFEAGTAGALEFHDGSGWRALPAHVSACAIVGELLAGWLGCTPPLHRVRSTATPRTSLVVFHQPALEHDVRWQDGSLVNAGRHIAARQAEYNRLDRRYR